MEHPEIHLSGKCNTCTTHGTNPTKITEKVLSDYHF
jgi:hypothetical protein